MFCVTLLKDIISEIVQMPPKNKGGAKGGGGTKGGGGGKGGSKGKGAEGGGDSSSGKSSKGGTAVKVHNHLLDDVYGLFSTTGLTRAVLHWPSLWLCPILRHFFQRHFCSSSWRQLPILALSV